MDLNHLNLRVRDPTACRDFYESHFGFRPAFEAEGGYFVRNDDGFLLALIPSAEHHVLPPGFHIGFGLATPDEVRLLHAELETSTTAASELEDHRPDEQYVTFRCWDPDGTEIEVFWESPSLTDTVTPVAVIQRWFAAHAGGDLDEARALVAPEAIFQADGESLVGFDEFMSWYARRREREGPSFSWEVVDLLGGESHAAAVIMLSTDHRRWRQVAVYEVAEAVISGVTLFESAVEGERGVVSRNAATALPEPGMAPFAASHPRM